MEKHKFGAMCPSGLFMEIGLGYPKQEKSCTSARFVEIASGPPKHEK
jgi:hypothetical protein